MSAKPGYTNSQGIYEYQFPILPSNNIDKLIDLVMTDRLKNVRIHTQISSLGEACIQPCMHRAYGKTCISLYLYRFELSVYLGSRMYPKF